MDNHQLSPNNPDWCYAFMCAIAGSVDETWTNFPEASARRIIQLAQESEEAKELFVLLVGADLGDIMWNADNAVEQ